MKTVLITGANRGLGLAFCHYYLKQGDCVIACCREGTGACSLQELIRTWPSTLSVYKLDVTNENDINTLSNTLLGIAIDVLINNAGLFKIRDTDATQEFKAWYGIFAVNSIAPYLISHAFKANLQQSKEKKIINISSRMGSISYNMKGDACPYRTSKAALNAVTKNLAIEFAPLEILVVAIHPGWVQTDMGKRNASLTARESSSAIANVIDNLMIENSGRFISYLGEEISW